MVDSIWDNSGSSPQAPKKSSTGLKIALGCGIVCILMALSCGSCVWWGVHKTSQALDIQWAQMHRCVEKLKTEAGTRALYQANPGLKTRYATEEDFLKAAASWRPQLGDITPQRPSLKALSQDQRLSVRGERINGRNLWHFRYQMNSGKSIAIESENDHLTDIRVE